jgi:NitT/TauT family transport system permease protein
MSDHPVTGPPALTPARHTPAGGWLAQPFRSFFALRKEAPLWQQVLLGLLCIALCLGAWWYVTRGEEYEDRILSPDVLPSPRETLDYFSTLWYDHALTRSIFLSLRRVTLGFALAALIGIPVGVLCGCFPRVYAFFLPLSLFGRNIPVAALIPLTYSVFGIDEKQKIIFVFIACVMFIVSDTARAVADVASTYVDTAYTLGANRWQVVLKVLVPLAMPSIFNSLRLLYGLAFGYIMLVESVQAGGGPGGLGGIINLAQRRGLKEPILLVLLIIPIVALGIDRLLFWVQKELFPYRYGGSGILHQALGGVLHVWDDFKTWLWKRPAPTALGLPPARQPEQGKP